MSLPIKLQQAMPRIQKSECETKIKEGGGQKKIPSSNYYENILGLFGRTIYNGLANLVREWERDRMQ